MRVVIHVNQHVIRRNKRLGTREPPVTVRTYKETQRCLTATILGKDGLPAARIVYRPDRPLPCGARVWVEVLGSVVIEDPDPEVETHHP